MVITVKIYFWRFVQVIFFLEFQNGKIRIVQLFVLIVLKIYLQSFRLEKTFVGLIKCICVYIYLLLID